MRLNAIKKFGFVCSLLASLSASEGYALPCPGAQLLQPGLIVIAPDPINPGNYINIERVGDVFTNVLIVLQNPQLGGLNVSTLKIPANEPKSMQVTALEVQSNGEIIERITHKVNILELGVADVFYLLPGTSNYLYRRVNVNLGTEECSVQPGPIPAEAAPTTAMGTLTASSYQALFSPVSLAALQASYNNKLIEIALLNDEVAAYRTALTNALESRQRAIVKSNSLAAIFSKFSSRTAKIAAKSRERSTRAAMLQALTRAREAVKALE